MCWLTQRTINITNVSKSHLCPLPLPHTHTPLHQLVTVHLLPQGKIPLGRKLSLTGHFQVHLSPGTIQANEPGWPIEGLLEGDTRAPLLSAPHAGCLNVPDLLSSGPSYCLSSYNEVPLSAPMGFGRLSWANKVEPGNNFGTKWSTFQMQNEEDKKRNSGMCWEAACPGYNSMQSRCSFRKQLLKSASEPCQGQNVKVSLVSEGRIERQVLWMVEKFRNTVLRPENTLVKYASS